MSAHPDDLEPGEVIESPTDPGEDPRVDPPKDSRDQTPHPTGIPDTDLAQAPHPEP